MEMPKLGFMAISNPRAIGRYGERALPDESRSALEALQKRGFQMVAWDKLVADVNDVGSAVDRFIAEDVDAMVLFFQGWAWASEFMQAAQRFDRPIMLWTVPLSRLWSIGGLAVVRGSFDEVGIPHKVIYGFEDNPQTMAEIWNYAQAAKVRQVLRRSTYGSIGGPGMGIHTGIIDANQWLEQFGILVRYTDQYGAVVEAEQIPEEDVKACYDELQEIYGHVPPLEDSRMDHSIRLYLGMEKVIEREGYDFTGVQCTFDLSDNYCSACLAQSLLNRRGFVTACLNDANGALTMYIQRQLTDAPVFMADVNVVEEETKLLRMIDDGAGSPLLAKSTKDVRLDWQPTGEAKASGVRTDLVAKPGRVTVCRVSRIQGRHVMHIAPGEVFEPHPEVFGERGVFWPNAFVRLDGDPRAFVQNLRAEYYHLVYGDLVGELVDTCKVLGIEPIVT